MAGGFQTQVNVQPAPAVAGDFASANPRFSVVAGAGALVAGLNGVTVGKFAWATFPADPDESPAIVNNSPPAVGTPSGGQAPTGFVGRHQQALITTFLADASMLVPRGFPVTLYAGGDFWVVNSGATQAVIGQKAFANFADGSVYFAATGTTPTQANVVGTIAAQTTTFVGSILDDILTVTSLVSGTIQPGAVLTGGTGVVSGTKIVSQLTGTAGGVGTYVVSPGEMSVNPALLTGTYGLLTVTLINSGALEVGDTLSGTGGGGVTTGTVITAAGAAVNTWIVNPSQTVTTAQILANRAIETKFIAMSGGLTGELVKISDHALG